MSGVPIKKCETCVNWITLKSNPLLGECSSSEDPIWGETKYAFIEDCPYYEPRKEE